MASDHVIPGTPPRSHVSAVLDWCPGGRGGGADLGKPSLHLYADFRAANAGRTLDGFAVAFGVAAVVPIVASLLLLLFRRARPASGPTEPAPSQTVTDNSLMTWYRSDRPITRSADDLYRLRRHRSPHCGATTPRRHAISGATWTARLGARRPFAIWSRGDFASVARALRSPRGRVKFVTVELWPYDRLGPRWKASSGLSSNRCPTKSARSGCAVFRRTTRTQSLPQVDSRRYCHDFIAALRTHLKLFRRSIPRPLP